MKSVRVPGTCSVRLWAAAALLSLCSSPLAFHAQSAQLAQPKAASGDVIFRALSDELDRSVKELQFKDLEKPYFIQYVVLDEDEYDGTATFGALTSSERNQARALDAEVRVGSYDFDNSEFAGGGGGQFGGGGTPSAGVLAGLVVENDYNTLRHEIWLTTDEAYKQAVEQLARKRAFVENKVREETIPDFSKEAPVTSIAPRQTMQFDQAKWEKQLRDWSAIFKEFPDIQQSAVSLRAQLLHHYLVNSEGTHILQPTLYVTVDAEAGVQAPDGMHIAESLPVNATSFDEISADGVAASIRQLAADLTAVRKAPVLDADYSGPVLLVGQASAEMFARVLAPNLSGQRQALSDQNQGTARSELQDRMNRPVLPTYLSVFDDPTAASVSGKKLIGHYQIDDQGVPSKRVDLVEDGILKGFLMSRRPSKEIPQSNGHGRSGFPGREAAQIGNLFIKATDGEGKDFEELKQTLIKMSKTENLPYGLMIKSSDSSGRGPLGTPILIYKVYVSDGHEELIRGASASTLSVRELRQIEAVGNDSFVANRMNGAGGAATPVSIVAPSVLLEEVELKRPTASQQKPSILTSPYTPPPGK